MQFVAASVVVHLIYVLDVTLAIAARSQPEQLCPAAPPDPLACFDRCASPAKFVRHKSQMVDSGIERDPTVYR